MYSLLNLEVFSCNKAQISWNPVTNPHLYNISDNQFLSMNAAFLSFPYHSTELQQSHRHVINTAVQHSFWHITSQNAEHDHNLHAQTHMLHFQFV